MSVARSLGLGGGPIEEEEAIDFDEEERAAARGFSLDVLSSPSPNVAIQTSPMCGGVLSEGAVYDAKSHTVIIIRVSSAGMESMVGMPVKVDEATFEIPVHRQNQTDFVTQLMPDSPEEVTTQKREELNSKLQNLFGSHVDYDALNNAFKALVPETEKWTVQVTIEEPYIIGDVSKALVCKAKGAIDAMVIVPLEKFIPSADQHPQVLEF